jgi:hypothetical protein
LQTSPPLSKNRKPLMRCCGRLGAGGQGITVEHLGLSCYSRERIIWNGSSYRKCYKDRVIRSIECFFPQPIFKWSRSCWRKI